MDLTGAPARSQATANNNITSTGSNVTPPRLGYFCIYNADFGPTEETQHEQLLYYVARKTVPIDAKMRQIGLAQGLTNFAKIFSPNAPCENVHSQKNRLVFYEAEPGYWLHMSIELGTIRKTIKGSDGKQRLVTEYQEHDLHDMALKVMLEQAYNMYRVAHGTMDSLVQVHNGNTRPLQRRLEEFYEALVLSWDFEGCGNGFHMAISLERALAGIHYLPLSRDTYVAIDGVLKHVKAKFEQITHAMVTFENQLVSSDIRDDDLQAVWRQVLQLTGHDYWQPTFQDRQEPPSASGNSNAGDDASKKKKGLAAGTFKFAKSWSNTGLFGFYKSATPTSPSPTIGAATSGASTAGGTGSSNVSATTTPPLSPSFRPPSRLGSPAPSIHSIDGSGGHLFPPFSGSTLDSGSNIGENKADLASLWFGQYIASDNVEEHFGIIYKHKSGLTLTFFILADAQEGMTGSDNTNHSHEHDNNNVSTKKGSTILEAESLARGIEELFSSHQYPSLEHYEARTQGDGNQELVLESNVEDATSTTLSGSRGSAGPSSPSFLAPQPRNSTNSTFGTGSSSLQSDDGNGEVDLSRLIELVAKKVTEDAWTARRLGGVISSDKEIRYLYFNRMNFAIKSRLGFPDGSVGKKSHGKDPRATPSSATSALSRSNTVGRGQAGMDGFMFGPDVALSLLDIKQDFERMPDAVEITTRSPANHWVVGKRFEDREVYMIVSRKESTLMEVEDEVRRITSLYFSGTTLSASTGTPTTAAAVPVVVS